MRRGPSLSCRASGFEVAKMKGPANAPEHLKACNNRLGHCGQCVTTHWEERNMREKRKRREVIHINLYEVIHVGEKSIFYSREVYFLLYFFP